MEKPLVFCIPVPVGAYHPLLRDCLASLAAQQEPLEVALLDASDDKRVRDLANEFDGLFAYRRHGPDKGQSDAILEGWTNTSGDVLGWLNADDILFPGALEAARRAFAAPENPDIVYGHSTIIDEAKRMTGYHWAVEPPGARILEGGIISQPSCFFKRAAYDKTGGVNRDLHYTMDWDLWIQLYKTNAKFAFIDQPLSMVMWAEGTKTSSFNAARQRELQRLIEENASPGAAKKTMRSFAIHNAFEKIRPAPLKRLTSRLLIRGRREIFGVSGDGLLQEDAHIFLTHFESAPKQRLHLEVTNARAIKGVQINGQAAAVEPVSNKAIAVTAAAPANAAETIDIKVTSRDNARCYFIAAAWAD